LIIWNIGFISLAYDRSVLSHAKCFSVVITSSWNSISRVLKVAFLSLKSPTSSIKGLGKIELKIEVVSFQLMSWDLSLIGHIS